MINGTRSQTTQKHWLQTSARVGVFVNIYFYDAAHDFIDNISYSAPRKTSFGTGTTYFSFPNQQPKYYLLELSYSNINSTTSDYCVIDNVRFLPMGVGINGIKNSQGIVIYPNPAENTLYFDKLPQSIFNVSLTGIDGKDMGMNAQNFYSGNTLDISQLNGGIYFIQLNDENGNILLKEKFIKALH